MSNFFDTDYDDLIKGQIYEYVADEACYRDVKSKIEKLWTKFEPYCENVHEFKVQVRTNFYSRCWELYLGYNLIQESDVEIQRKSSSAGPDFNVLHNGTLIHIEAICPENSKEVEKAYHPSKLRKVIDSPNNEKQLVMTGALYTKIQAYNEYLRKGVISASAPFVIALNSGNITFSDYELLIGAIFDIGPQYLEIAKGTSEVVNQGFSKKIKISGSVNTNKKEIPANLFLSEYAKGISGIIFSSKNTLNLPEVTGSDLYVIPNPLAKNSLPRNLFSVGKEYMRIKDELILHEK